MARADKTSLDLDTPVAIFGPLTLAMCGWLLVCLTMDAGLWWLFTLLFGVFHLPMSGRGVLLPIEPASSVSILLAIGGGLLLSDRREPWARHILCFLQRALARLVHLARTRATGGARAVLSRLPGRRGETHRRTRAKKARPRRKGRRAKI
jgi:hypothetical protein